MFIQQFANLDNLNAKRSFKNDKILSRKKTKIKKDA